MQNYHDLLQYILDHGAVKGDRTGTGTLSVFGYSLRFDLAQGFPLVTTKKVHLKSVIEELLWFLRGETNIRSLVEQGVHIWTDWPLENYNEDRKRCGLEPVSRDDFERMILEDEDFAWTYGDLGPVYGQQWTAWNGVRGYGTSTGADERVIFNQLADVVEQIKTNPDSRRLLVSAWNPADIPDMALPPCHYAFQFYVQDGKLSCMFQMRSNDTFLGLPFNIASYALLTLMVAQATGLRPGELIVNLGDAHLYVNHIEQAKLQLSREIRPLPVMHLNPEVTDLFAFRAEDFTLEGYDPHPAIRAPVAV